MSGTAEAEFRREAVAINLARIPWLLAVSLGLALWAVVGLAGDEAAGSLRLALLLDMACAALFLALGRPVRRLPAASPWRVAYVWAAVVGALAFMDGYYFLVGRAYGQSPAYILGVVTAGAVFLLPPRLFLPLLLANHLVYAALLAALAGPEVARLPVLVENTTGAAVAGLATLLLYRARRDEFLQRRALAAANRALARRNAELADLMAITAHDLRSPLIGMRDLLALAAGAPPPARLGAMLDHARRTCAELIALVGRLLDAHAAEARAEGPPALAPADLGAAVRAAAARAEIRAAPRGIALALDLPGEPVVLAVDAPTLGQVLDNLLSNAVKASPPGATVNVRLAPAAGGWHCDVADAGPGVPEAERAALFRKFHRGAGAAEGEAGSGLGLFIAATLIQAMGGRVEHHPVAPHGALFRIVFAGPGGGEGP